MKAVSVLKAGHAMDALASRVILRGETTQPVEQPTEPGVWISQSELELLKTRCMEQGRKEGEEQGRRAAQQAAQQQAEREAKARFDLELKERQDRHVREQAEKWRGLATALASEAQTLRERLAAEVTEWTFIAVARLLGQQAPEDVAAVVRQVLDEAQVDGTLTVLLHARDLAGLQACRATDAENWPQGLTFAPSDRVSLGGCLIQSDLQTLDARLEVQLALLRETLDTARRERAAIKG